MFAVRRLAHRAATRGTRWTAPPTPSRRIVGSALVAAVMLLPQLAVPDTSAVGSGACGHASLTGTPSRDVLHGTTGPDVIDAGAGNDVVWGYGGRDVICGGRGADLLLGGPGSDHLQGGIGVDGCDAGSREGCEWRESQPRPPILAGFYYPWFPEAWDQGGIDPYTRFHPTLGRYDLDRAPVRRTHLDAMRWAGMQAGIASWWGVGTETDRRLAPMLRTAAGGPFRWSVYYEGEGQGDPTPAQIADDLSYLGARYGTQKRYLRIGGRFVVFVYAEPGDGCDMADRWSAARTLGAFVVLKVFDGYEGCASQPDAWHQYAPAVASDAQGPHSFSISPGFWKADEGVPRLGRNLDRWRRDVQRMLRADVRFRLVTTFNEWGEGTAVESAREWRSSSGYGTYLDVLHRAARGTPRGAAPRRSGPACTIEGTAADDVVRGTAGRDRLCGLGGNDILLGREGDDSLIGGTGSDRLIGGSGDDRLIAGGGLDALRGDGGADELVGGAGNDDLLGGGGMDALKGGPGVDRCPGSGGDGASSCNRQPGDPVIVAAGDIACVPGSGTDVDSCRGLATAKRAVAARPWAVLLLGDNQYEEGTLADYQTSFARSWGRLKALALPTPGNHEYLTPDANGYFRYFGPLAAARGRGYYSVDVGRWHVVALNSSCSEVGGCDPGDPQYRWLRRDLAMDDRACTLAFWHHPRFSSGEYSDDATYEPLWQLLYNDGAEIVLNGHDHNYQHYRPQDPQGVADPNGIREFVVGSGGKGHYPLQPSAPNRIAATDSSFGVLRLALHPRGYDWRFIGVDGGFDDRGSAACR